MSLINCPECRTEVSSIAEACPKCGAPIARALESQIAGAPLTTVQETSKKFKLQIVLASILFWVGLFFGFKLKGEGGVASFVIISLIGAIWYVVTKIRVWWHHK